MIVTVLLEGIDELILVLIDVGVGAEIYLLDSLLGSGAWEFTVSLLVIKTVLDLGKVAGCKLFHDVGPLLCKAEVLTVIDFGLVIFASNNG